MNLRIKFYWYTSEVYEDGILRPSCTVLNGSDDDKLGICYLLTDDGGLGVEYLMQKTQEYITAVESVQKGICTNIDCFGQAWGAEISNENVVIYWGFGDVVNFETISCDNFRTTLDAWLTHLKSVPSQHETNEFDLTVISISHAAIAL